MPAPTSPVEWSPTGHFLRRWRLSSPCCHNLPHTLAWTAWLSPPAPRYLLYNLLRICLWKLPYSSAPQALIGSEYDPAPQGGWGIHCTCATGTSDPQVKAGTLTQECAHSPTF